MTQLAIAAIGVALFGLVRWVVGKAFKKPDPPDVTNNYYIYGSEP
jgi:hypothetical protein